jgi:hypothetical protein
MSHGQMLQNTEVNVFDGRPEFSSAFMRSQNIKTISGTFVYQGQQWMSSARQRNSRTYKFNRFGELTFEYKTLLGDTLLHSYMCGMSAAISLSKEVRIVTDTAPIIIGMMIKTD